MALSLLNVEKYNEAVSFLKSTIGIFERLRAIPLELINKPSARGTWKPWQTGVIVTSRSIIDLAEYLLKEEGFKFLMTRRLTQDCAENLFSVIRRPNPRPDAKQFRSRLRLTTLTQFMETPSNGNYDIDDSDILVDFLKFPKCTYMVSDKPDLLQNAATVDPNNNWKKQYNKHDTQSFYYWSGHLMRKVLRRVKWCPACKAIITTDTPLFSEAKLTRLREFSSDKRSLIYPSIQTFDFLKECEFIYIANSHKLITHGKIYNGLKTLIAQSCGLSSCADHDMPQTLASVYAKARISAEINNKKKFNVKQRVKGFTGLKK